MKNVENKLIDLCLDPKFEEIKNDLKLIRYQYIEYCDTHSPELVDEMLCLLLDSYAKVNPIPVEVSPINEAKFKNQISLAFYRYMVELGMSPKTANDYVKRVNQICNIEELFKKDIQPYIDEYTNGSKREENIKKHNAPSSALKKFNEFKKSHSLDDKSFIKKSTNCKIDSSDCLRFDNSDKIRLVIDEKTHDDLVKRIFESNDNCDPIIVSLNGEILGEYEIEDSHRDDENSRFFQLVPFVHIYLKKEPDTGWHSFKIIEKHVVGYEIEDKKITLTYEENRILLKPISKEIDAKLFKELKFYLKDNKNYLNDKNGSYDSTNNVIMQKFPFGGYDINSYSYKIGKKEGTRVYPLFNCGKEETNGYPLFNDGKKLSDLEDIITQIIKN